MNVNNQIKLLTALFIVVVFGVSFSVPHLAAADHTTAHTIQQLQEQIEQLQARIKILQQQLGGTNPTEPEPPSVLPGCRPVFLYTLYRGVNDKGTGGEVTKLQKILAEDPTVYPEGLVTGYYGELTEKAVQRWQAKQGVISSGSPATTGYGIVGQQTRAKIIIICPPPIFPTDRLTVLSPNGGETWTKGTTQTITWRDSVLSRPAGEALSGSPPPPARYYDIKLAPRYLRIAPYPIANNVYGGYGTSHRWSVGDILAGRIAPDGPYTIQVCQTGSTICDSSDNYFTIVSGDVSNLPPTISGVSSPSVLKVGEVGKWEVKASDPEQGPLTYSIIWGDETAGTSIAERAIPSAPSTVTQTAMFTHVYSKAGTYNPAFTVTDNGGLSAKTSVSVSVTGGVGTSSPPVINRISQIPTDDIKVNQSVLFSLGATDADGDNLSWSISWGDGTGVAGACQSPNPQNKQVWTFDASHAWANAGTYTVRATVSDCRGGSDEHAFTVDVNSSLQSSINVLSPNSGEAWIKGTTQTIRWYDRAPFPPPCPVGTYCIRIMPAPRYYDIKLIPNYPTAYTGVYPPPGYPIAGPYTIAKGVRGVSDSSYSWSVGKYLEVLGTGTGGVAPDGLYTIQVCQTQTASKNCDSSDSYFRIVSGAGS
ncbi:MAG: peptidoglycan-binding protein [Candidatus Colwellbacteria bacterium]|nr:peptidoglycan-binding protein [Candidatus Colwellbacteria bacterium]